MNLSVIQPLLTWVCLLQESDEVIDGNLDDFLNDFLLQVNITNIELYIIDVRSRHKPNINNKLNHNNIKYINIEKNVGIEKIWNSTINIINTKYITIVNLYDRHNPKFSKMFIDYLETNNNCYIAVSKYYKTLIYKNKYEENNLFEIIHPDINNFIISPYKSSVWRTMIYKNECLSNTNIFLENNYWLHIINNGYKLHFISENPLYLYNDDITLKIKKYKIAVVSALFLIETDNLDTFGNFNKINLFDYILFTNNANKIKEQPFSELWDIREISSFTNGLHATKHVKFLTHEYLPDYDVIIWVDTFITPNIDFEENIFKLILDVINENAPIIMRTQQFKRVYDDIEWCIKNNRITEHIGNSIIMYLLNNNFNVYENSQTYWSSAIIKNNKNNQLKQLGYEMYNLITKIGIRDQHWLPYLFNKYNIKCNILTDKNIFKITGIQNQIHHNYVKINNFKKVVLIDNSRSCHYEIIESIINNICYIIKENIDMSNIIFILNLYDSRKINKQSFIQYIKTKNSFYIMTEEMSSFHYKNIKKKTNLYDYYINTTFYPDEIQYINKNSKTDFYICHKITDETILYNNIYYLYPFNFNTNNVIKCTTLPYNNIHQINKIPIYIIQGDLNRKNIELLIKILNYNYNKEFKIKILTTSNMEDRLKEFSNNIIFKQNLNFEEYHREFIDCYGIIPLIDKMILPDYYSCKVSSSINYGISYKLKFIIDKELCDIFNLNNCYTYTNITDICSAFNESLHYFYNKTYKGEYLKPHSKRILTFDPLLTLSP
jgi:hypothetical protein